jgi:RNA polymerase sigma-70 factor (ECF subfamily)
MESSPQSDAGFSATFREQSASLRRLARSLVGDPAAADDVVQETWTAYLSRPPAEAGAIGGFLATLTRRLAWRAQRGEQRRRDRERLAAQRELDPGPDEFAERAAVLREVLDALATLREPYRRALWQRYFDDRPPREIARESGESLATVKSRLQRGLELLREELDRRHGGRRSNWAVVLLPFSAAGAGILGLGVGGGVLMGSAVKFTAAAIVIAGLGTWYLWSSRSDVGLAPAELAAGTAAGTKKPETSVAVQDAQADSQRSAVAGAAAAEEPALVIDPELAHPYLYMLVVRTLDEYGLPLANAPLKLAPVRSSLNIAKALSEQAGCSTLIWRGKEAEMDVDVQFGDAGTMQGSRRVHLRAGVPGEVALLGAATVREDLGVNLRAISFVASLDAARELQIVSAKEALDERLSMGRFPHPHARFADRFVERLAEPVALQSSDEKLAEESEQAVRVLRGRISLGGSFVLGTSLDMVKSGESPDTSRVSVHVVDDQGEALAHALVALGREIDGRDRTAFTNEHGDVEFDSVEAGWWEVRAGGGPGGLVRERLFVEAPNPQLWSASLDRGARVIGHVQDSEGQPALNTIIRYESTPTVVSRSTTISMTMETKAGEEVSEHGEAHDASAGVLRTPWVDQTAPREDGSFEIANLPLGLGRLLVLDKDHPDDSALIVEEGVLPGEHEFVLRAPAEFGTLRLRVQFPIAIDKPELEVRAISESTGRGSPLHADEEAGLVSFGLAPGWYRVELGAGYLGWHDLGRQYVGPGAHVDLGTFALPPPARVHVVLPPPAAGEHPQLDLTFYLRRSDLDIRGEPHAWSGNEKLFLPAGDYWAFWTTPDGMVHHKAVKLEADADFELDLR